MNFNISPAKIEEIVPGAVSAYEALRSYEHVGIYTSNGAFYNNTFFARDVSMSAKFVADFDDEVTRRSIYAIAELQGDRIDKTTQEEPGRVHHEMRDFRTWRGRVMDRIGFAVGRYFWGVRNRRILTYFAADTTALYIRLVYKFASRVDRSVLNSVVEHKSGKKLSVEDSVIAAAEWLTQSIDNGIFIPSQFGRFALPYQTFQDSLTAYFWPKNQRALNAHKPIGYVEAQFFAIDALQAAAKLLPRNKDADRWSAVANQMLESLIDRYWDQKNQFFYCALSYQNNDLCPVGVNNISAGWSLNNNFWDGLSDQKRQEMLKGIIQRLFSDEFLTPVGIRTRSKYTKEPLGSTVDYHGSQTVWPMFNFMIIEGLRRHGFFGLSAQLENRLINGVNANQDFREFFIVTHENTVLIPNKTSNQRLSVQFKPEKNIAFTIVPSLVIAHRKNIKTPPSTENETWKVEFEEEILSQITQYQMVKPTEAISQFNSRSVRLGRFTATLKTLKYVTGQLIWPTR